MLKKSICWNNLTVRAKDGDIGTVDEFYFDDETWAVRYITAKTGKWLDDKQVLISPMSIIRTDWQGRCLEVSLTMDQVAKSPDIDTHAPVSRQHEAAFLNYYGYPYYWAGPYLWGPGYFPAVMSSPAGVSRSGFPGGVRIESADSHLRSTEAVKGYNIHSSDGEIGHVDGFLIDDNDWAIRYVEVATRNWLPGKKVLIPTAWIDRVSWARSEVFVSLSQESIKTSPAYVESAPVTREYEERLHSHFGRPTYWLPETAGEPELVGTP